MATHRDACAPRPMTRWVVSPQLDPDDAAALQAAKMEWPAVVAGEEFSVAVDSV